MASKKTKKLPKCPDCGVLPGNPHLANCDVERCTVCGMQRYGCACIGHDKMKAKWTGKWPNACGT